MSEAKTTAEIIAVGNEILIGRTLDTNSNWLSKRLYQMNVELRRITIIPDDVDAIAQAINEACSRNTDWVIMTGGLGPTYDDKTLEGLAKAAGKRMIYSEEAMQMVNESVKRRGLLYQGDDDSIMKGRKKMATIPEGSKPLANPVGTAPAVLIKIGRTNIASLPGVPEEMKAIFEKHIAGMISSYQGKVKSLDVVVYGVPEAAMADMINKLAKEFPELYIKSHPSISEKVSKVTVQFTARADAAEKVDHAISIFKDWLDKINAKYELVIS